MEFQKLALVYEPINLPSFIKMVAAPTELLAKAKLVSFRWKVHDSVPEWFLTDKLRLKQVLNNLLNNALKFTTRYFSVIFSV
jgi:signal transduction histidine kinase